MDLTKIGFGTLSLGVFLQYFHLNEESLKIYSALLIIDVILGIAHAYMRKRSDVKSTTLWVGIGKKIVRFSLPFSAAMILRGVGFQEISLLVSTIMSILIASEGYSILRHYMYISTKKEMSEIDAIEYVLTKIADALKPNLEDKNKKKDV